MAREGAWPAWQEPQRVIEERAADPAMDRVAGRRHGPHRAARQSRAGSRVRQVRTRV